MDHKWSVHVCSVFVLSPRSHPDFFVLCVHAIMIPNSLQTRRGVTVPLFLAFQDLNAKLAVDRLVEGGRGIVDAD